MSFLSPLPCCQQQGLDLWEGSEFGTFFLYLSESPQVIQGTFLLRSWGFPGGLYPSSSGSQWLLSAFIEAG